MLDKNTVTLIGRLTGNPDLRTITVNEEPASVCHFGVAVNVIRKKGRTDQPVEFIPISVFGKRAEACAANLTKGKMVSIEDALHFSKRKVGDKTVPVGEVRAHRVDWLTEKLPAPALSAAA